MLRSPTPVLRAILASRSVVVSSRQFARKMAQNSTQGGSHASTDHTNHGKKSSDTAWLVGSIAVTVPGVLYLLYSSPAKKPSHHHSNHHSSSSALKEGETSSGGETKSQGPAPELVSEATEDARDQAKENFGEMGVKAGELYGGAKGREEASITSATDKAASVKEGAGETSEPVTEGLKNRAHGGDEGSRGDTGEPGQGEGKKGPDDSQGRDGVDILKEPIGERKNVEKTGGDSKSPETLSNPNRKQTPSKTPSQVGPPVAGTEGPTSTNETNGK